MEKTLSFIRNNNWIAMTIAVVAGVLLVVGGVQAATTISTNIETAGTITVGEERKVAIADAEKVSRRTP